VNIALVIRNWLFGYYIVEFEQQGVDRAEYGSKLLTQLSNRLKRAKIKGCSETRLKLYRMFYLQKQIRPTPSDELNVATGTIQIDSLFSATITPRNLQETIKRLSRDFILSWSHYVVLLTVEDSEERSFYEIEAAQNSWSVRELERQINSSLYERLILSQDKEKIKKLSKEGLLVEKASDLIKNPFVLEFLGLESKPAYSEKELETAIIDQLEHFLLELGKGFLFEARQKRFTFDNDHFYVDLVFYNRLLRCYVLIDLKIDKLTHQDLGQMQMYVNHFDRSVKTDEELPTIGIVLCSRKNDALVELTLPEEANIFASRYQLYLPSKEDLKKQIKLATQSIQHKENS
jgi:predicted nuclease of restriction endonuclease-like (RecB) superfamily